MIAVRLLVDGVVVREAVFVDGPVVIGRGPESDFVIVDPSVSRRHARVLSDAGTAWIEDAGSRNGLRVGAQRVEKAVLPAAGTVRCRLGSVELELATASADPTLELAVPAAVPSDPLRALRALSFLAAGVAAWCCLMLIEPSFWSPWRRDQLTDLAWLTLGLAVGLPILAFVLIGFLRVVGRRARVSQALRAFALLSWGWVLLALVEIAGSYGLGVRAHGVLTALLESGGAIVTVACLASVARLGPRRRFFATWAAAVAVLLTGLYAAARLAAKQAGTPNVDYEVGMPIAGITGPASSVDGYLEGLRADFTRAERRAEEDRKNLALTAERGRP